MKVMTLIYAFFAWCLFLVATDMLAAWLEIRSLGKMARRRMEEANQLIDKL